MARPDHQRLYDALQAAEREWRAHKATGCGPDEERAIAGPAGYEREALQAYQARERELFARVEAAHKAWHDAWAAKGVRPHRHTRSD